MLKFDDILSAQKRIEKYIYHTPLERSIRLSSENKKVFMKLESQQKLRNFKVRGALSKVTNLTDEERSKGIMAVSSGNHGSGVSYAAHKFGNIKARVYVPETTPDAKLEYIKYYGAEVIQKGLNFDETYEFAMNEMKKYDMVYVDASSDYDVIAGSGTIALEILEQSPEIDTMLVPIGGGGLITGIGFAAKHINPKIKIIGVQTSACVAMTHSLKDNKCYTDYPSKPSVCDALVGGIGQIPFEMAKDCIDEILEINDENIVRHTALLMLNEKIIVEPSSAVCISAILDYPAVFEGRTTAAIITGGNVGASTLKSIFARAFE